MFNLVKKYNIDYFYTLIGKNITFISDCEFFPNFNVTGILIGIYIKNNEILFKLNVKSKKDFIVGSNMKNLKFKINDM